MSHCDTTRPVDRIGPRTPDTGTLILLDFDGVIADSMDAYFNAFSEVCSEMGYRRLNSREAFLKLFEGNPIRQLLWAGFPLFRLKRVLDKFKPRLMAAHELVRPFDGIVEVVSSLARGFPVFVITSNVAENVCSFLKRYGVPGVAGIVGSETHASKVKKIRRVLRQYPNHRAYYVSDTKGDLIEARRAGAIPVAVAWGWHSLKKLAEGKPELVVSTPKELRDLFTPSV
jgi:phosphoglycolate phosphatase